MLAREAAGRPTYDRKTRDRLEAVRDLSAWFATAAFGVVVVLVLTDASLGLMLIAWAAFVADLLLLQHTTRRLRQVVEQVPRPLSRWARPRGVDWLRE